jgi:hypothetical protein
MIAVSLICPEGWSNGVDLALPSERLSRGRECGLQGNHLQFIFNLPLLTLDSSPLTWRSLEDDDTSGVVGVS